ncbi:hypothetical protein PR048_017415 [Dryococelus australis]|uniref:Uncharacterized protein n=1 Tax=Dryococelus australis TaxID=614101 RepID=A0ABQ9H9I4_9NEOP|nr:hypothetical protein PR048_017415 [Dryococelus australis]
MSLYMAHGCKAGANDRMSGSKYAVTRVLGNRCTASRCPGVVSARGCKVRRGERIRDRESARTSERSPVEMPRREHARKCVCVARQWHRGDTRDRDESDRSGRLDAPPPPPARLYPPKWSTSSAGRQLSWGDIDRRYQDGHHECPQFGRNFSISYRFCRIVQNLSHNLQTARIMPIRTGCQDGHQRREGNLGHSARKKENPWSDDDTPVAKTDELWAFIAWGRSGSVGREPDSGAAVTQWVEHPIVGPRAKQRVKAIPGRFTLDFRMWGSCRTMTLVGGGHGGSAVNLLASHQGEPGSIPDRATPGLSHEGIVPNDATGRRVFSGISHFPPPFIPALLHSHLNHPHWFSLKTRLSGFVCTVSVRRLSFALSNTKTVRRVGTGLGLPLPRFTVFLNTTCPTFDLRFQREVNFQKRRSHLGNMADSTSLFLSSKARSAGKKELPAVNGATGHERLVCSSPTKASRVQSSAGTLRISASGNRAAQCHWSADFLEDLPFPLTLAFRCCIILASIHPQRLSKPRF